MKREQEEMNIASAVDSDNTDSAVKATIGKSSMTMAAKKAKAAERIGVPRRR